MNVSIPGTLHQEIIAEKNLPNLLNNVVCKNENNFNWKHGICESFANAFRSMN